MEDSTIRKASILLALRWLFLLSVVTSAAGAGKQWAFLVAGSKGWINYRHQADLCHAYHVLRNNGVPAENIITMFYDDVAHSSDNPNHGVLINRPNGTNVYEGVVKDYTGKDVSVNNLRKVLMGDKAGMEGTGSGRVIESGPEDTIFFNLIDHGSPGFIDILDENLYADALNDIIKSMNQKHLFKKMVIFVEACEGGSMFDSFIDDQKNVFVMTAAAPDEGSFVSYYDDRLNTYIGDSFSTSWLELMDKMTSDYKTTSLFKMYTHVRTEVTRSHVMVYGDFLLGFDSMASYLGQRDPPPAFYLATHSLRQKATHIGERVSSRDVDIEILKKKLENASKEEHKKEITSQIENLNKRRDNIDAVIEDALFQVAKNDSELFFDLSSKRQMTITSAYPCYGVVVSMFDRLCINSNEEPYATKHFYKLMNICTHNINLSTVKRAFRVACGVDFKGQFK